MTPIWFLVWTLHERGSAGRADQRLKEERQELKQLKDQLKGYKNRLERTKRRERNVVQDLEESDRLLQQKRRELQAYERNLKLQATSMRPWSKQMEELTPATAGARGTTCIPACVPSTSRGASPICRFCSQLPISPISSSACAITVKLVEYDADLLQQHRQSRGPRTYTTIGKSSRRAVAEGSPTGDRQTRRKSSKS